MRRRQRRTSSKGEGLKLRSTKKGNQYRHEAYVGTDIKGIAHSVVVTPASTHDAVVMDECLHGEEEEISEDKASVSAERKRQAEARGITWRVLRKATMKRKLTCSDTRRSNRTRARAEHTCDQESLRLPHGSIQGAGEECRAGLHDVRLRHLVPGTLRIAYSVGLSLSERHG